MKILYVITKSNWGGAQKHVFDLATAMKDAGHTPVVALGGDGILRQKLEDIGIKTYAISTLGRNIAITKDAGSFHEVFSVIRREKPNVLHVHSPKAAGIGALAGRLLGVKKIIYTVHGWAFNVNTDLDYFNFIIPCGISDKAVTSMQKELGRTLDMEEVKGKIKTHFQEVFGCELIS